MIGSLFNEFAILLSLSVIFGLIAIKLRQPLILSYILVGIIAGPGLLGWISSQNEIEVLASFGVTLLLFIVGLKLDFNFIRTVGSVVFIIGLAQIVFTVFIFWLIGIILGFALGHALFIAITLTFSSTIIIVKVLSDRFEIDSLYGRVSVGILIVQDLVVVIAIIALSSLKLHYADYLQLPWQIGELILKGIAFLVLIGLVSRFLIPSLLNYLAKSRELLILFAISWAVILAVIANSLGFSKEVGGFLAGMSLASTHYREAIASRLEPVRNILLLFFFLNLGASFKFDAVRAELFAGIIFSLAVLMLKPLIVMLIMGKLRFRKRTSFLTGLTMGQISEFSLIFAALGETLGYIDSDIGGLITFIGIITIGLSTYMIVYGNRIYQFLSPWLNRLEHGNNYREDRQDAQKEASVDVIIFGFGRHGEHIAKVLESFGLKIMGVDFDPRKTAKWHHQSLVLCYGDAEDAEFPRSLPLKAVKWVVSTIPHQDVNRVLVSSLKELKYQGKIALCAYHEEDLASIQELQVDLVLVPYKDAAFTAAERLLERILSKS